MRATQIAIVEITKGGADKAVFVDGHYIVGADPAAGDLMDTVYQVAEALADGAGLTVTRLEFDATDAEWQWGEVEQQLKKLNLLWADSEEGGNAHDGY